MRMLALGALFMAVMAGAGEVKAAATQGTMQYDTASNQMEFSDGTGWYYFASVLGIGACSTPGTMDYDTVLKGYKVCNGTTWLRITGMPSLTTCTHPAEIDFREGSFYYCNGLVWVDMRGAAVTTLVASNP